MQTFDIRNRESLFYVHSWWEYKVVEGILENNPEVHQSFKVGLT